MKRNREEKAVIAKRRKGPGKIFLPIIWLTGMVVAIGITGVVLRIKNKKE